MSENEEATGGCLLAGGGICILLGALNAALALTVDTCTGGSADSLRAVIFTIPLYLLGFALMVAGPRRYHITIPLLLSPIALWHSAFAARFAVGHWSIGVAECDAFEGRFSEALQEASGSEPMLIAGWGAASLIFWGGVILMWVRSPQARSDGASDGT